MDTEFNTNHLKSRAKHRPAHDLHMSDLIYSAYLRTVHSLHVFVNHGGERIKLR
jgi:hypothetical protein